MRSRSFLAPLRALVLMAFALSPCGAVAATDPGAFMNDVSAQVLKLLQNKQQPDAERSQQFAKLVDDTFDVPRIARFVLGQNWRSASPDEQQQFTATFKTYMVQVYWARFNQYNGQSVKVTGQRAQSDTISVVSTQIIQPTGQPTVRVEWTVTKEGDGYKIIDVSIEGVSQVLTYRQEFASIIAQNGGHVSALIAELNKKIQS
jgi:phospholipid transport system substrate-binding protein